MVNVKYENCLQLGKKEEDILVVSPTKIPRVTTAPLGLLPCGKGKALIMVS